MSNFWRADHTTQWFQDNYPGADMHLSAANMVVVLHTTESISWPDYEGGATAPNYTGLPPVGLRLVGAWRAHFPDEKSARALVNSSGGVETNTLNAVQIELIGTCDPKHAKSWDGKGIYLAGKHYVFWPNATNAQLRFVGRILADFHRRHGLRLEAPRKFISYPSSYGTSNGVRLSFDAWRQTTGIVGHQHVPENVHGDPGNINIGYILEHAKRLVFRKK